MVLAADRATIACSVYGSPAESGGKIGAVTLVLADRTVTPFWPLSDPAQVTGLEAYRDIRQCMMFAADAADWTAIQVVTEGQQLVVAGETWFIRRVDRYDRTESAALTWGRQEHLVLYVEKSKVA